MTYTYTLHQSCNAKEASADQTDDSAPNTVPTRYVLTSLSSVSYRGIVLAFTPMLFLFFFIFWTLLSDDDLAPGAKRSRGACASAGESG